jgi:hypothetical protein
MAALVRVRHPAAGKQLGTAAMAKCASKGEPYPEGDLRHDVRWRLVFEFSQYLKATKNKSPDDEYVGRFEEFCAALASIADDTGLPSDQRDGAAEMLKKIEYHTRKYVPEMLKTLASIADRQDVDATTRADAQSSLESYLLRLKEIIEDPGTPPDLVVQAIRHRRAFLSS